MADYKTMEERLIELGKAIDAMSDEELRQRVKHVATDPGTYVRFAVIERVLLDAENMPAKNIAEEKE